jgi:hypothetical protein
MRLLQRTHDGGLSITDEIVDESTIPPYAILSHTWGAEVEAEVTFEDFSSGIGETKHGYEKIRFCKEQVRQDGLQYFWIDTCCINKADKAEHSRAIQSMFRWYGKAARCYVYLSDVSKIDEEGDQPLWESEFQKSKWFTRGWTLQELLAPSLVEFFSKQGTKLGDKTSLRQNNWHPTCSAGRSFIISV